MLSRIRISVVFAMTALILTSITAFAKGGFSFITITGTDLDEEIRSTDPALTEDFFAFADFYRDKTVEPANPGIGYVITRYYIEGTGEIAFDSLHYYPETGFVYYGGIAGGGSSEYDGEWYTAKPEIKRVFEGALSVRSMDKAQPNDSTVSLPPSYLVLLAILGIAAIFLFAYRLRQSFSR